MNLTNQTFRFFSVPSHNICRLLNLNKVILYGTVKRSQGACEFFIFVRWRKSKLTTVNVTIFITEFLQLLAVLIQFERPVKH